MTMKKLTCSTVILSLLMQAAPIFAADTQLPTPREFIKEYAPDLSHLSSQYDSEEEALHAVAPMIGREALIRELENFDQLTHDQKIAFIESKESEVDALQNELVYAEKIVGKRKNTYRISQAVKWGLVSSAVVFLFINRQVFVEAWRAAASAPAETSKAVKVAAETAAKEGAAAGKAAAKATRKASGKKISVKAAEEAGRSIKAILRAFFGTLGGKVIYPTLGLTGGSAIAHKIQDAEYDSYIISERDKARLEETLRLLRAQLAYMKQRVQ